MCHFDYIMYNYTERFNDNKFKSHRLLIRYFIQINKGAHREEVRQFSRKNTL